MKFAFPGRVSTEDQQDPESSRAWQRNRAVALIEPHGGVIVAEYFDIGQSRSLPWQRRPRASELLRALRNPDRGFGAVVLGEPHRAFYDNQFGLTFPLSTHYGVQLWVPEVGGPPDPGNEVHDLVMSVFGGMSKGERNRSRYGFVPQWRHRPRWRAAFSAGHTDEILLDVDDVAMGHTSVMRWNPRRSESPPTTPRTRRSSAPRRSKPCRRCFGVAATVPAGSTSGTVPAMCTSSRARCAARCAIGGCRVSVPTARRTTGAATPRSTPLANKIHHPRNVYLHERDLVGPLDTALARAFAPNRIADTVAAMAEHHDTPQVDQEIARAQLADANAELTRHKAALEAGADPTSLPAGSGKSKPNAAAP